MRSRRGKASEKECVTAANATSGVFCNWKVPEKVPVVSEDDRAAAVAEDPMDKMSTDLDTRLTAIEATQKNEIATLEAEVELLRSMLARR